MIFLGSFLPNLLILSDLLSCLDEALTLASLKKAKSERMAIRAKKIEFKILPTSNLGQ